MLPAMLRACLPVCLATLAMTSAILSTASAQNQADEPKIDAYSFGSAVAFLDKAAQDWTDSRKCFTCHTNYAYLIAKPLATSVTADPTHRAIRAELEKLVDERWAKSGPRWDAEVVMSAAVLAINDRATSGKLHSTTRTALERMWKVQREDGGFAWLKCGWPPMESDDDYGIAIAALATGAAPDNYKDSEAAKNGLAKLRSFLDKNPAPTLHHQAMLLWPETYGIKLLSDEARQRTINQLISLQKPDGGWNSATLGNWKRGDGSEQDTETSDGYATGFVLFVLQQTGHSENASVPKGIAWLKANQRASGRWHTRSLNKDSQHFLSHAGTAFAIMALADKH